MIVLDLSILNQKGTPMFNSDTFANRPSFGIVGRIFISTDTAAIYRDTGTAWDLIADGGSSSTNIYNSNGTLSANRVVSDGGFGLSFTPTTHIGSAAIGGGGSGKLIVGSSTADNGIQIFGANAPSLRIDNAQSAGTQRFIIGLATSTNNFIQGAIASDFCITTASSGAILFGMWQSINASEVMRITTTNNLLIGSSVDGGQRLQVTGSVRATSYFLVGMTAGSGALYWTSDRVTLANYNVGGSVLFEVNGGNTALTLNSNLSAVFNSTIRSNDTNGLGIGSISGYRRIQYDLANTRFGLVRDDNGLASLEANAALFSSSVTAGGDISVSNAIRYKVSGIEYGVSFANAGAFGIEAYQGVYFFVATGSSTSASEKLRVTNGGNLLVGTTTDAGFKLDVNGTGIIRNLLTALGNIKAEQTTNTIAVLTLNPNSGALGTGNQWNLVGANSANNYAFQIREASSTYLTITNSASGAGGSVGIGTTSPSTSALLDVTSTTKGFLPPRMTTTQINAIGTPAAGLIVYDTTLNKLCVRTAAAWETITSV